jgi:hypothetical protein
MEQARIKVEQELKERSQMVSQAKKKDRERQ